MSRVVAIVIFLCLLSGAVHAQRGITIEYTDVNGIIHQVMASDNESVVLFRTDGSAEVSIDYDRGQLQSAAVRRKDGSVEAHTIYKDGLLQNVTTRRRDGSAEAHITYRDGALDDIASFTSNGRLEAIIGYQRDELEYLSIADPDRTQKQDEQLRVIEFFPIAQIRIKDEVPICERIVRSNNP